MSDTLNSATANADGSYTFSFTFDSGIGIFGNTNVNLPAPVGTPAIYAEDGVTVVTAAIDPVPYTPETAKEAALPLALAQKTTWAATLTPITGVVTL